MQTTGTKVATRQNDVLVLMHGGTFTSVRRMAGELDINLHAVEQAVYKLRKRGLVAKGRPLKLTWRGRRAAGTVVRKLRAALDRKRTAGSPMMFSTSATHETLQHQILRVLAATGGSAAVPDLIEVLGTTRGSGQQTLYRMRRAGLLQPGFLGGGLGHVAVLSAAGRRLLNAER